MGEKSKKNSNIFSKLRLRKYNIVLSFHNILKLTLWPKKTFISKMNFSKFFQREKLKKFREKLTFFLTIIGVFTLNYKEREIMVEGEKRFHRVYMKFYNLN